MFGSIGGLFSNLKQNRYIQKITNNLSQNYQKIKSRVATKLTFVEISSNIFYIDYPQLQTAQQLKQHISHSSFQIWNLSEYKYDSHLQLSILGNSQDGQIHNLCYQLYTNIPFYELVLAIATIHKFTALNQNNKVYIHCQDNRIRSGIFLSCYIYRFRIHQISDISQAILLINKLLNIKIEEYAKNNQQFSFKNQHIIFKNFINYHNNRSIINPRQIQLVKLIINNTPSLSIAPLQTIDHNSSLKVYLQIRCGQTILLKRVYASNVFEGSCICLKLQKDNILLVDEFLIMVKYFYDGNVFNLFRLQLNSNFIFHDFIRILEQDIDLSSSCTRRNDCLMHLDLIFLNRQELSNLALLNDIHEDLGGPPLHSIWANTVDNRVDRMPLKQMILQKQVQGQVNGGFNEKMSQQWKLKAENSVVVELQDDLFDIMNENQLEMEDELDKRIMKAIDTIHSRPQTLPSPPSQPPIEQQLQEDNFDDYFTQLEAQS